MSYNNDSMLVIANQMGLASSQAKAELFETYDKIRDLTVGGTNLGASGGYGALSSFLMNLSRMVAPTSFMPILGNSSMNIPGTSYYSPLSGGNSIVPAAQSAFGMGSMGTYPGFPSGGAAAIGSLGLPVLMGIGNTFTSLSDDFTVGSMSFDGLATGGAASLAAGNSYMPSNDLMAGVSAASGKFSDYVLPTAGVIGGVGSLITSVAPYFGPFGLVAGTSANLLTGYAGAVLTAYQTTTGRIINNADSILSMKVKNIETIVKQLDTQGDIVRKMLKTGIEADSKSIQEM